MPQAKAQRFVIAERARKIGSPIRSLSDISRHQRLKDNNEEDLKPERMLELQADNLQLTKFLRGTIEMWRAPQ